MQPTSMRVDETAANPLPHCFRPIRHVKFSKQALQVRLDRVLRNPEHLPEFAITQSFSQQFKQLVFPSREVNARRVFLQARGDTFRQVSVAGIYFPNRIDEFIFDHAFEKITHRARRQRLMNIFISIIVRNHQHPSVGKLSSNRTR